MAMQGYSGRPLKARVGPQEKSRFPRVQSGISHLRIGSLKSRDYLCRRTSWELKKTSGAARRTATNLAVAYTAELENGLTANSAQKGKWLMVQPMRMALP